MINDFFFYRKPPNKPWAYINLKALFGGFIHGGGGALIYGEAYIRTRFCVSNINHLLTLFLYNTRLIYKQG